MRDEDRPLDAPAFTWLPRLVLAALIALAFCPLLAGFNFLPFEKYPNWGTAPVRDAGQVFRPGKVFQERKAKAPWVVDSDFVGLSLYWPQDLMVARSIREGRLPLWDPTRGGGYPTFDNGQFRPFNPLRIPFFAFPSNWMYSASLVLGLLFGAWGAFLWLRREGYLGAEALVGAGVFVLNPWVLERLTIQEPAAYFFLPWVLLAIQRADWRNVRSIALPALALVAMAHVGQPEPCLLVTAIAAGRFLFPRPDGGWGRRAIGNRLLTLAAIGAITLGALALLWVPLVRLSALSFTYKKAGLPFILESSWWAPFTLAADLFVAPGLLVLLFSGLSSRKRRPWYWLSLMLVGLLAVMPIPMGGSHLKAWLQLVVFVIPLTNFKLLFWAGLSFALPSGMRALREGFRRAEGAAAVAGVFGVGMVALAAEHLPVVLGEQTRLPIAAMVALLAGPAALVICVLQRGWDGSGALRATLLVLPLAFPLSLDHISWNSTPRVESDLAAWIRSERPHDRIVSAGLPFALPPDSGQAVGVRCGEMNAAYFPNSYFQLFFQPPAPPTLIAFRSPEIVRFRQMGATVMLVPSERVAQGQSALRVGKWTTALDIPGGCGRLLFATETASRQEGKDLAAQILELGRGSDGAAVVETMGQPAPTSWPWTRRGEGLLSFVLDGPEEIVISAEAPSDALLVLRDTWYPGWKATVDGSETAIYRANGCFRAVRVPAGRHQVHFRYHPTLVYISGAVSLATTLLILAAFLRRRRGQEAEESPGPAS